MITSIKHKGLKKFFEKDDSKGLPADMKARIKIILAQLNQSESIEDMNIFSFKLHQLVGKRKGEWAVTVKGNWRITFKFEEKKQQAFDVNFEDYH